MNIDLDISKYLGPEGIMANTQKDFKFRMEQLSLSEEVINVFTDNEFLAAEIGTGVGKTYAYLIPAILWSLQTGEKVIISTKTKALQQQISERDLPLLRKVISEKFFFAEAKGRENYLCWNKYVKIISGRKSLDDDEQLFVNSILTWAENTKTGDRKELTINSDILKKWYVVGSDRRSCLKDKCFFHDNCFRLKMINRLQKADVIVVNHSLLLANAIVDNTILPPYKYLIIDEAHTFDRESFDKLSINFSKQDVIEIINNLTGIHRNGYLYFVKKNFNTLSGEINKLLILLDKQIELTNDIFASFTAEFNFGTNYNFSYIFSDKQFEEKWFFDILELYLEWQHNLNRIVNDLRIINEAINVDDDDNDNELSFILNVLIEIGDKAFLIMEESINKNNTIIWLNYIDGNVVEMCSSVLNVGENINEYIFKNLNSLILISATLSINGDFNYFLNKNGLLEYCANNKIKVFTKDSPFNYDKQAQLILVEDFPDPNLELFDNEVVQGIKQIINTMGGNILVLFTSKKQLIKVSQKLRSEIDNIKLLVQHEDGEFNTLIDEFKSHKSVLMGLDTYWEGLDLRGNIIKCIVVVKIPFRSPSEPYSSSWEKYYRMEKKNSFTSYLLPDALIKFKQGVGRLIRSEYDNGVVIVFDNRILNKNYGKLFKDNIPIKNIKTIKKSEINNALSEWFNLIE